MDNLYITKWLTNHCHLRLECELPDEREKKKMLQENQQDDLAVYSLQCLLSRVLQLGERMLRYM